MAIAEVNEVEAEAQLSLAKAKFLLSGDDDKIHVKRAQRDIDPEIQKLHQSYRVAHAKRKIIATIHGNCERDAALISRELTRRTAGDQYMRRADKHGP